MAIYTCPNPCFYRFIHHAGIILHGQCVLDLGFGHGQDLREMARRGAIVYGIEIDPSRAAINPFDYPEPPPTIVNCSMATGIHLFKRHFDLIYSLDTFNYLSDIELLQTFGDIKQWLAPTGSFVFQVITGDYSIVRNNLHFDIASITKNSGAIKKYRNRNHVISLLRQKGFVIMGEKLVTETFYLGGEAVRHNLYIIAR